MNNLKNFFLSKKYLFQLVLFFMVVIIFTACFGSKPVSYFSNGQLDTNRIEQVVIPDQLIQKGDILSITIFSDNPEATSIYNQAGGTPAVSATVSGVSKPAATGSGAGSTGYLVDNNGNIQMHQLGVLQAEGKTKSQLTEVIISKLNGLGVLSNPYCVIRFSNFKITILGEVRNPGVFTLTGEKTSLLEAFGLAGDITDYGLKDRVLMIREVNGQRTYNQINLLDPQVLQSPEFYVRQNDILLVQADKRKPTALDQQTLSYIAVGATVVSSIAILITLFR